MAAPKHPKATFSFRDHSVLFPTKPQPGDELDTQFKAVLDSCAEIIDRAALIQRDDGNLQNQSVHLETLAPDVLGKIINQVKPDLTNTLNSVAAGASAAAASATQAQTYLLGVTQAAQDAAAASSAASVSESDAQDAANIATAAAGLTQADATAAKNAANHAVQDANQAHMSAEMAMAWAEYLPDTIPPRYFPDNAVTGDHWSARWWANKATNAFGHLTSLYLGVHPDHATALASVTNPPIAIGAIYYNSAESKPYVWDGKSWMPFWSPQKALTTTLFYRTTAPQTDFPLSTPDLFTNSFTLDKKDTEPLELYVNGVRMFPSSGTPPTGGDYTIDVAKNTVSMSQPLPTNAVVTIDILTPRDKFAIGSVNFHALLDIDLDPVTRQPGRIDGVTTTFSLMCADGTTPAIGSAVELFVSVDGVIQQAGKDYNVLGTRIQFTDPPRADSKVWALWMEPSATGGGGKGVQPPVAPHDTHSNAYEWDATNGAQWSDIRGRMHSVSNGVARLALKDPEELIPGALVYERDTKDIWAYTPTAAPASGTPVRNDIAPAPGSANFKAQVLALRIGDTILYKGQYYQVMQTPTLGEESFPGGTSYAISNAMFVAQFAPVSGPSWNNYQALRPGQTAPVAPVVAAGDPKQVTNWTLLLPGHPTDGILRSLDYDPSKPNKMAWEDARDQMETVSAVADLNNRTVLPLSHLMVGKIVYVRATGALYECLVDGTTGTATNTLTDWKQMGGGIGFVGRAGNLPTSGVPDGAAYVVHDAANGNPMYSRLVVWDAVNNIWTYPTSKIVYHGRRDDPADTGDWPGDIQVTSEAGHALIETWDGTAWLKLYDEDQVKQWIAASNLFQGTVQDRGHGTVGAIDLNNLKAESALGVTDAGHYYIFVGLAGHTIGASEIGGAACNINGAKLNVGDWILVANTGTATAPVMKYTHVPGDLLAKSRGDNLYGLNAWAAGGYEIGSLVVYQGDIYRSSRGVLVADTAPGTTGAPWTKVDISGGVKTVAADSNLPATATNGAVYLVLSSARAGGRGALYMWDTPSAKWQPLGGSGSPLDLSGGKKLINYGTPIGTVITFAGKTLPAGYLLCDGSTFSATTYPELNRVLGGNTLPDLRSQFIRGANNLASVSFTKHGDTTKRPSTNFTGSTNSTGAHTHGTGYSMSDHTWKGGGSWSANAVVDFSQGGGARTSSDGAHTHSVEINGGGDRETAPVHVILAFLIKADDIGTHAI